MSDPKFRFSIDEPAPKIPRPKEFGALLGAVNAKKPWYVKGSFLGGTAIVTTLVTVAGIYFSHHPENSISQVKTVQSETVKPKEDSNMVKPVVKMNEPNIIAAGQVHTYIPQTTPETEKQVIDIEKVTESETVKTSEPEIISEPVRNVQAKEPQFIWFSLPYDTLLIPNVAQAGKIDIGNGNSLNYPANAWVNSRGIAVTGPIKVLYRQAPDQASMIFSRVMFGMQHNEKKDPIENNGCFEICAIQENTPLKLAKDHHLVMNFRVNNIQHSFSGMQYQANIQSWDYMDIGDKAADTVITDNGDQPVHTGYTMDKKRGFWAWLRRIFTRPKYRKLPGEGESDNAPAYKSVSKKQVVTFDNYVRSFEIYDLGWFGSGREVDMNAQRTMNFRYRLSSRDTLMDGIFQVYLNRNVVVYHPGKANALLHIEKSDRCMLIAFCANKNCIAVLNADQFDARVKNVVLMPGKDMRRGSTERDLILDLYKKPIRSVNDLKLLIQTGGITKPAA